MQQIKPENQVRTATPTIGPASSRSWEGPITDSQAVAASDYLLTEQEANIFLAEDGQTHANQVVPNNFRAEDNAEDIIGAPSWEVEVPHRPLSIEYPQKCGGIQTIQS